MQSYFDWLRSSHHLLNRLLQLPVWLTFSHRSFCWQSLYFSTYYLHFVWDFVSSILYHLIPSRFELLPFPTVQSVFHVHLVLFLSSKLSSFSFIISLLNGELLPLFSLCAINFVLRHVLWASCWREGGSADPLHQADQLVQQRASNLLHASTLRYNVKESVWIYLL